MLVIFMCKRCKRVTRIDETQLVDPSQPLMLDGRPARCRGKNEDGIPNCQGDLYVPDARQLINEAQRWIEQKGAPDNKRGTTKKHLVVKSYKPVRRRA